MSAPATTTVASSPSPPTDGKLGLELRVYKDVGDLDMIRNSWGELLSHYPPATTFCTWEWLRSWWECFGEDRRLLTIALFRGNDMVGLAPLSISKERMGYFSLRAVRLMGDGSGDSDNLDLPVRPGFEQMFAEKLLQYLWTNRRDWDICLFNTLPHDSLMGLRMSKALRGSRWSAFEYSTRCCAVVLPESWELYISQLSTEDQTNLARYTRRLDRHYSVRTLRCQDPAALESNLEELFQLHQGRWQKAGQPGSFSSQPRRTFYLKLARRLMQRGWLELWLLQLDGCIAAAQFAFRYGDKVFQLQEGYDHDRASDRPGYVLRGHVLQQLISSKIRVYDFLGGEDSYKSRWGAVEGHYRHIQFAPTLGIGGAWLHMADKSAKGKEWLRKKSPPVLWNRLHHLNMAIRKIWE